MIRETAYGYALVAVSGLFLLSAGSNWWLFGERDAAKAELSALQGALKTAQDAGRLCGESVTRLVKAAADAKVENAKLIEAAGKTNLVQQTKAHMILAKPATRPGNDCGSATDRGMNWLKGRAK